MSKIACKTSKPARTEKRHRPGGALNIDLDVLERAGFVTSIDGPIVSIMGPNQLSIDGLDAWHRFIAEIGLPADEAEDYLVEILDAAMWNHVRRALGRER